MSWVTMGVCKSFQKRSKGRCLGEPWGVWTESQEVEDTKGRGVSKEISGEWASIRHLPKIGDLVLAKLGKEQ